MTSQTLFVLGVAAVYFAVVLVIGVVATRRSSRSPEEYFLAGRGLGTLVLFMALFGTNCTPFVLLGIPGMSWAHGIGVFGLNAAIVALGIPLTFWAIGSPARRMARRLGALTPAELYARRLGSRAVGGLLFVCFTLYTIPYMVQGVQGASLVLARATDGSVPGWLGGLAVLLVALVYTGLGGMRATAWTNVLQGGLFLGFMLLAIVLIARSLGGPVAAMEAARAADPELLVQQDDWLLAPRKFASWGLVISFTVIAFPHMFARLMAAEDERAIRGVVRLYPLALALLWVPAVLLGVWGRGAFPELERPDLVFGAMTSTHLPAWLGGVAFVAILAAVMSTLDAQLLTLSSMLLRDVVTPLRGALGAAAEVLVGRAFTLLIAGAVYALSRLWGESIFDISAFAFEGYTTLVPTLFLGVRWRRFTAAGALASLVAGNSVLLLGRVDDAWALGFLPALWAFVAACVAGVLVSLATPPQGDDELEAAFGGS